MTQTAEPTRPELSIIIVNWNTEGLLRRCLASLRPAIAACDFGAEVIVVDNASGDGSAAMVAREFPEVTLVANELNRNYAEGNNQGIELARGDSLLLLNPDTEIPETTPEVLAQLVGFLRDHPKAGAVSPALIDPDGSLQASVRGFPTPQAILGSLTGLGRLLPRSAWGAYFPRGLSRDHPTRVDQPMASAFLIRRDALPDDGPPFDPAFPLFFNDVDLCYRIARSGWEIWYDPTVRILHVGGASTRQVRPEAIIRSHEGLAHFYEKHYRSRLTGPGLWLATRVIRLAGRIRASVARVRSG